MPKRGVKLVTNLERFKKEMKPARQFILVKSGDLQVNMML